MPSLFVPARSSRHRTACFALYRSLLRQAPRVPLPAELSTASPLGPANPIQTLIRNAFHRNKRDTSPRLVVSALKNGYRYLTLLSRAAADPDGPEHADALAFLRRNQARVVSLKEKAAQEAANRISTAPIKGRAPLLKRVSPEGAFPPVYEPAGPPRPLEAFRSGVRKPPTLAATLGVPFLRFWKPQPRFLERVVRQKSQRRAKRIGRILEMQGGEEMESAVEEDQWEGLVARMLAEKEGKGLVSPPANEVTYKQSLWDAVWYLSDIAEKERVDLQARGEAMWKIVLTEQEMALQEEKDRLVREGREGEEPQVRVWSRPVHKKVPKTDPNEGNKAVEEFKLSIRRVAVRKANPKAGSDKTARGDTNPAKSSTEGGLSIKSEAPAHTEPATETGPSTQNEPPK